MILLLNCFLRFSSLKDASNAEHIKNTSGYFHACSVLVSEYWNLTLKMGDDDVQECKITYKHILIKAKEYVAYVWVTSAH